MSPIPNPNPNPHPNPNKVASNLLKTPPSIVVYGDTTCVPRYDVIARQFA